MEKIRKNDYYSIAILICLLLVFSASPLSFFLKDVFINQLITLSLKTIFIFVMFYTIHKYKLSKLEFNRINKTFFYIIPLYIICFSNLFVVLFNRSEKLEINTLSFIISILITVITAFNEEIVFRGVLLKELLKDTSKTKSILISSAIFGGIHILNISSIGSIPSVLLQVGYTFFMGLIFAFSYVYFNNILVPISFHLLFNLFNGDLINNLYNIEYNFSYFLINISIGLLVFIYLFILYLLFNKEEMKHVTKHLDI